MINKSGAQNSIEAINPRRRFVKAEMKRLGFKTRKAYKKWVKKNRMGKREGNKHD